MHPDQGPGVTVGLREIYEVVLEMKAQLTVLVGQHADQSKSLDDHEERIRALERSRWPLPSLSVLISLAALLLAFARGG